MTSDDVAGRPRLRFRWWSFVLLGIALAIGGSVAILLPTVSTMAAGLMLGAILGIVGIIKIVQAFETKEWPGFLWQLLAGGVEIVGGILIYFNPLKGAAALTLMIAVVFVVLGLTQLAAAWRIRREAGGWWLFASGLLAIAMSLFLTLKFPHVRDYEAGVVAGLSLLFSGLAYVAIGFAARKAQV